MCGCQVPPAPLLPLSPGHRDPRPPAPGIPPALTFPLSRQVQVHCTPGRIAWRVAGNPQHQVLAIPTGNWQWHPGQTSTILLWGRYRSRALGAVELAFKLSTIIKTRRLSKRLRWMGLNTALGEGLPTLGVPVVLAPMFSTACAESGRARCWLYW